MSLLMTYGVSILDKAEYRGLTVNIDKDSCAPVYALSIAEGLQEGDIFTAGEGVLFRHYCGFALIYGNTDQAFLEEVYNCFLSPNSSLERRFVLFAEDERAVKFFEGRDNLVIERRFFYRYPENSTLPEISLPEGFELARIDEDNFDSIKGRITPLFSWKGKEDFLCNGCGWCVMHGDIPSAWAFSAALSSDEVDIGVETLEEYRGKGLALIVAKAMIRYCMQEGKRPVWACHSGNIASQRLAEKAGFVKCGECFTVRKG